MAPQLVVDLSTLPAGDHDLSPTDLSPPADGVGLSPTRSEAQWIAPSPPFEGVEAPLRSSARGFGTEEAPHRVGSNDGTERVFAVDVGLPLLPSPGLPCMSGGLFARRGSGDVDATSRSLDAGCLSSCRSTGRVLTSRCPMGGVRAAPNPAGGALTER